MLRRQLQCVGQPPALKRLQADYRIDQFLKNFFRMRRRHFFDLDAAFGGADHGYPRLGTIEHHAQVELPCDIDALLDEHLAYFTPFRAGLMGYEFFAEHLLGRAFSAFGTRRELHAAGLAAPTGMDLRFDDAAPAQLHRRRFRLLWRKRHFAVGYRHAVASKQILCLKLVNVHGKRIEPEIETAAGILFRFSPLSLAYFM